MMGDLIDRLSELRRTSGQMGDAEIWSVCTDAIAKLELQSTEYRNLERAANQVCECVTQDSLANCMDVLRGVLGAASGTQEKIID